MACSGWDAAEEHMSSILPTSLAGPTGWSGLLLVLCATACDTKDADNQKNKRPRTTDLVQVDTDSDGIAEDTGGTTIDDDLPLDQAPYRFIGTPGGALGWQVTGAGDVDGDGLDDVVISDAATPEAYLLLGPINQPDVASADVTWSGRFVGHALDGGQDVSGDGLDDVAMGGRLEPYEVRDDVARVLYGAAGAAMSTYAAPDVLVHHADGPNLAMGATQSYAVALVGDADGDGRADLAVGNRSAGLFMEGGAVWLLAGPPADAELDTHARARFYGGEGWVYAGSSVRPAGDQDSDGLADILIGTPGEYDQRVYIGAGSTVGAQLLDATVPHIVSDGDIRIREAADGGEDHDGDGYPDLLILATDHDGQGDQIGSALMVSGPVTGAKLATDATAKFAGQTLNLLPIETARFAGDVNGDGFEDIVVGAAGTVLSDPGGIVGLFYGPGVGSLTLASADVRMLGEQEGAEAGTSIDAAGDVDGDGLGDLVIGSPGVYGIVGDGAAYIILGGGLP